MTSLTDIGELTTTVEIRRNKLKVQGISAEGLMSLLQSFPELRNLMVGNADEGVIVELVKKLPKAVVAIIAIGLDKAGDENEEAAAKQLAVGEQLELVSAIWKLTFPKGLKSFIDALEALANEVAGESGKDQDTKSPGQSSNVSETATLQAPPGDTHPGS